MAVRPAYTDADLLKTIAQRKHAHDPETLPQLGFMIENGNDAMVAEMLPRADWGGNPRQAASFWRSLAGRMHQLSTRSPEAHARITALFGQCEPFKAGFRQFMASLGNSHFFLGGGMLEPQLDAWRGIGGPWARWRVAGIARDYVCSPWFEAKKMALFGEWPVASWLDNSQKKHMMDHWASMAQDNGERQHATGAHSAQAREAEIQRSQSQARALASLIGAGWLRTSDAHEAIGALAMREDSSQPSRRIRMDAIAIGTMLDALGDQAKEAPYLKLWVEAAERRAANAPADGAEPWRLAHGRLRALSEAADLQEAASQAHAQSRASAPETTAEERGAQAGPAARRI